MAKVQVGLDPDDRKPFDDVGTGTKEILIREASGIYRVMYVAKFEEARICPAPLPEEDSGNQQAGQGIAEARYRAVVNARKAQK